MNAERTLSYLAVPYSHPDPEVRAARFKAANRVAGILMQRGHLVFSPISHTHPIAEECDLPRGWDYWSAFDRAYLAVSKVLIVLCIDGWRESVGITGEMSIAADMDVPVEFITEAGEPLCV